MASQQEIRQKIMDGLDRSCDGIEEAISSVDLGNINFPHLRSELVRRIATLEQRLEQYSEQLDDYFVRFIVLRMEHYAQFVAKLDEFTEAVGRYGNQESSSEEQYEQADSAEAAYSPPPVPEQQPVSQAPMPPPGAPTMTEELNLEAADQEMVTNESDQEEAVFDAGAVAFDVTSPENDKPMMQEEVDAPTMQFRASPVPEQFGWDGQQTPLYGEPPRQTAYNWSEQNDASGQMQQPPAPEPQEQPAYNWSPESDAGDQTQQAAAAEPEVQSEGQDDDLMYAQTMQFSMQDIEAARRGERVSFPRPEEQQQQTPPQSSFQQMNGDGAGETVSFDQGDQSSQMQSGCQQQGYGSQQQQPPEHQAKKKESKDGSMITGSDLMDQMDSFFDFGS